MGYSTNAALVEENWEVLTLIKEGLYNGKNTILAVDEGENISSEQYKLRRILASADRHPEACRGEFANLGQAVTLNVEGRTIIVKPRGKLSLSKALPTIETELSRLESFQGSIEMVTFAVPEDATDDMIVTLFHAAEWELHISTRQDNEDGTRMYAVERITEESSAFDRLQG